MSTAVPRMCTLCGNEIGLGNPFVTGTGVNRVVHQHVTCRDVAAKTKPILVENSRLRDVLRRIAQCSEDPISAADAATALRADRPPQAIHTKGEGR